MPQISQKQVLVLAFFVPIINSDKKVVKVLYIYYLIRVYQDKVRVFFDSRSKINSISPDYAQKLDFKIRIINNKAKKIGNFTLKIFEKVIVDFQIEKKIDKS